MIKGKYKNYLYQIKIESDALKQKTDDELALKVHQIKKRIQTSDFLLDSSLVEWFSLVQEFSFRKIGLRHFDTQLLAGIYLHEGKIVEMKTGEGKTLASTLPISFNSLKQKGVHVITVNDYLAERDQKWMGKVYKALTLTSGLIKNTSSLEERKQNYSSDITYITNSQVVFDYLRDNSRLYLNEIVQRPFSYCIIDEIDSILIDEARTPLILSDIVEDQRSFQITEKLALAKEIATLLRPDIDFNIDEKRRDINLTQNGYEESKRFLGKENLYDFEDPWVSEILNALKAKYLFRLNKDYIVQNDKILIVDEFTGRIMEDRRWNAGIHEAVEVKENVSLGDLTKTKSSITYQNFFNLYPRLAGMTGTAKTAEKEFKDIYNLEVVVVPTWKPGIRQDLPDVVYPSELIKWKGVIKKAQECFLSGQPLLIGTTSVEKSDFLSELFTLSNLPHQVLNAKPENIARESQIVGQAGERFSITIATNMAGRGTDIVLGGNPIFKVKQILSNLFFEEVNFDFIFDQKNLKIGQIFGVLIKEVKEEYLNKDSDLFDDIQNLPYSLDVCGYSLKIFYTYLYAQIYPIWEEENTLVKSLGGLYVLATERHETRRIDNQLCGRAGRQGDPGISQFFVSLEDDLLKIFGGNKIRSLLKFLKQDDEPLLESGFLTSSLEKAQKKVEVFNYEIRKNVFQYDEILNLHRKGLFEIRQEIFSQNLYNDLSLRYAEQSLNYQLSPKQKSFQAPFSASVNFRQQKLRRDFSNFFEKWFKSYSAYNVLYFSLDFSSLKHLQSLYCELWISNDLRFANSNSYQSGFLKSVQTMEMLRIIDIYWTAHIERMAYIRETINWRSFGQVNPLIEYNLEAFQSYKLMFEKIRNSMLYYFLIDPIIR